MPFGSKRGWPARHGARPEQFGAPISIDAFNTSELPYASNITASRER